MQCIERRLARFVSSECEPARASRRDWWVRVQADAAAPGPCTAPNDIFAVYAAACSFVTGIPEPGDAPASV